MRFVHDHRKAFSWQLAHAVHDHTKLLQRCHDDAFPVFQCLLEILRRHAVIGSNVHQHPRSLDHLLERALELAVNHATVRNDDHRAENVCAFGCMQRGEAVCQPSDSVGFAAACAMLVQVIPPRSVLLGIGTQFAHAG